MRAWPAAQQLLFDGWVARLSDGYTKRANSASLLYPQDGLHHLEALRSIETLYRSQHLPVIFRLLSFSTPAELDPWLADRGYREADGTLVMTGVVPTGGALDPTVRPLDIGQGISAHARMNNISGAVLSKHQRILERITSGLSFVGLFEGGELVACGLSVLDGDLAGLFDIVTDPAHRRMGHGARLVRGMMAPGRPAGRYDRLPTGRHDERARYCAIPIAGLHRSLPVYLPDPRLVAGPAAELSSTRTPSLAPYLRQLPGRATAPPLPGPCRYQQRLPPR